MKTALLTALTFLLICSCAHRAEDSSTFNYHPVSELLDDTSAFDGHAVTTTGVASMEFEHTAIYPSTQLAHLGSLEDCVWLSLSLEELEARRSLNGKLVEVRGIFREGPAGHLGVFRGMIDPVFSIEQIEALDGVPE